MSQTADRNTELRCRCKDLEELEASNSSALVAFETAPEGFGTWSELGSWQLNQADFSSNLALGFSEMIACASEVLGVPERVNPLDYWLNRLSRFLWCTRDSKHLRLFPFDKPIDGEFVEFRLRIIDRVATAMARFLRTPDAARQEDTPIACPPWLCCSLAVLRNPDGKYLTVRTPTEERELLASGCIRTAVDPDLTCPEKFLWDQVETWLAPERLKTVEQKDRSTEPFEFQRMAADAKQLFDFEFRRGQALEKAEAAALRLYKVLEPCPVNERGEWSADEADQQRLVDYAQGLENLRGWCAQWKRNPPTDALVDRANASGGIGELRLAPVALDVLMKGGLAIVAEVRDCPDEILLRMIARIPENRGEETLAEIRDALNPKEAERGSPPEAKPHRAQVPIADTPAAPVVVLKGLLGPGAIVTEPPPDTSGVIRGWKPLILEREGRPGMERILKRRSLVDELCKVLAGAAPKPLSKTDLADRLRCDGAAVRGVIRGDFKHGSKDVETRLLDEFEKASIDHRDW